MKFHSSAQAGKMKIFRAEPKSLPTIANTFTTKLRQPRLIASAHVKFLPLSPDLPSILAKSAQRLPAVSGPAGNQ